MRREVQELRERIRESFGENEELVQAIRTSFPQYGSTILKILKRMGLEDPERARRVVNILASKVKRLPSSAAIPKLSPKQTPEIIAVSFLRTMEEAIRKTEKELEKRWTKLRASENWGVIESRIVKEMVKMEVEKDQWGWEEWEEWVEKTAKEILREMR